MKKFAHLDIRQKRDQVSGKDNISQIPAEFHAAVLPCGIPLPVMPVQVGLFDLDLRSRIQNGVFVDRLGQGAYSSD